VMFPSHYNPPFHPKEPSPWAFFDPIVFRVTESAPVRIAPPSIFPAIVGEVVVVVVLKGDSVTGAPKSMRPALWVVATPGRAMVAPRL
jgi:hypothetical protein